MAGGLLFRDFGPSVPSPPHLRSRGLSAFSSHTFTARCKKRTCTMQSAWSCLLAGGGAAPPPWWWWMGPASSLVKHLAKDAKNCSIDSRHINLRIHTSNPRKNKHVRNGCRHGGEGRGRREEGGRSGGPTHLASTVSMMARSCTDSRRISSAEMNTLPIMSLHTTCSARERGSAVGMGNVVGMQNFETRSGKGWACALW
jgi:hypothetical protein